jgi:FkbM family methyltransferase
MKSRWWAPLARILFWRPGPRYRRTALGIQLRSRRRPLHLVSSERLLFYRQGVERRLAQVAREYGMPDHVTIKPGDAVIDVGANIGEFSLVCSEAGATVYALEPDIKAFLCLTCNVAGRSVVPLNAAAWREDSVERLHMATESADSSFVNRFGESREVLALRLDTLARMLRLDRVKLIKCDAEGAEPEVLAGATELLAITEYVTFDCGPEREGRSTLAECEEILTGIGFRIVQKEESGRFNLVARNTALGVPT